MADYRSWCGYCNNEINFGSHKPDCSWLQKQRDASREQREFNDALYKQYQDKTAEEIVDEAVQLHNDIQALSSMLRGKEKLWEFLRYELMDKRAIDSFREKTGRRYL